MLIDLLCTDNYVSFNINIAKAMGLNYAIYISELLNISNKATAKKKLLDGKFKVDRDYIANRTTIKSAEQLKMDEKLYDLGIIDRDSSNNDVIAIDVDVIASMISGEDTKQLRKVSKLVKLPKTTMTKAEAIAENLKKAATHRNAEIQLALQGWVDSVLSRPNGFLSKPTIEIFKDTVDDFANGDLDLALAVIRVATINGWRDADWAIDKIKQKYPTYFSQKQNQVEQPQQKPKLSNDEVF